MGEIPATTDKLASPANGNAIEAERLDVAFAPGLPPALNDMKFHVPRHKISYLVGPSGIGKSTLIKVIIGKLKPMRGTIKVLGTAMDTALEPQVQELRRQMGILYQNGALFQSINLVENVMFPLVERRMCGEDEAYRRAMDALAKVGLDHRAKGMPDQLSGGQRKRGGLARALVIRPKLLLCDEPSSGLDPVTSAEIDELILELQRNDPELTTVVISHDLDSIKQIAEHVVFLHYGRIPGMAKVYREGARDEVLKDPDPIIRGFFDRLPGSSGRPRGVPAPEVKR